MECKTAPKTTDQHKKLSRRRSEEASLDVMASGSLPSATYHRTNALGSGSYGAVVTVYNDDGDEFALKLFLPDEEDEVDVDEDDYADDDDDEDQKKRIPMDLGALREMSILRLLRDQNAHENIVRLVDIQSPEDLSESLGAGTSGYWAMALPFYGTGSLAKALDSNLLTNAPRKVKVEIAHGLLSAVAYLHDNGIFHRDIKPDNVMLEVIDDDNNSSSNVCRYRPILIDFSLAKIIQGTMYHKTNWTGNLTDNDDLSKLTTYFVDHNEEPVCHTGEVGTVAYTAPEVLQSEPHYGVSCDMWSVGVVLLELLLDRNLPAYKNKDAERLIDEGLQSLPEDQPFPNLIRGLLREDPDKRLTARQALASPLFAKFHMTVPPIRLIDISAALPIEANDDEEADENHDGQNKIQRSNSNNNSKGKRGKKTNREKALERRLQNIKRVGNELQCQNPMTYSAAMTYCEAMSRLDDSVDDPDESQTMVDCLLVAMKFFEVQIPNLSLFAQCERGLFEDWSLDTYLDNEICIFMVMDYCLYPRELISM